MQSLLFPSKLAKTKFAFGFLGLPNNSGDGRRSISETRDVRNSRPTSARFPTWPVLPTFTTHYSTSYGEHKECQERGEKNGSDIGVHVQNVKGHMNEVVRNHLLAS